MTVLQLKKIFSIHFLIDISFELSNQFIFIVHNYFKKQPKIFKQLYLIYPRIYRWPPAYKWFQTIIHAFKMLTNVTFSDIPQLYSGVITIDVLKNNLKKTFYFDYSDDPLHINTSCLDKSTLYFKMQFIKNGYNDARIIPGQFIAGGIDLYYYLSALRKLTLNKKRFEVYGRFGAGFAQDIRGRALLLLKAQNCFRFTGELELIRYSRYLREIAQSKICIDLPGNGPFCFRLIEYLAVGVCIISPPHKTIFNPSLVDGIHIKYCKPDLSDLVDLCYYYLTHDSERIQLANNARIFFDHHLSMEKMVQYYLEQISKQYP